MGRSQLAWAGALTAAAVTAWAALSRPVEDRLSDLHVYLGAVSSPGLYDFIRGDAPFTYPPFAALLFRPLADLAVATVQVLWTAATIATVAFVAFLAANYLSATASTPNLLPRNAGWLALALMLSAPFSSNIRFGQVSIFLTAAVLIDLLALRRTRWSGVLIGVAAAIKLTPLIFIPMLFLAANRQAALRATATFAACTTAAAIASPTETWRFWTEEIFHVSRLGHITSPGNQSLNGMLLRLDLPPDPRTAITITVGGAIAAAAIYRASQAAKNNDWLTAATITGAASVVLSPVSWTHHQTWLVLAAFLPLTTRLPASGRLPRITPSQAAWPITVLAVMLLPITALGTPLWTNARLFLAIAVAALIPFPSTSRRDPERRPSSHHPLPPRPSENVDPKRPTPHPRSTSQVTALLTESQANRPLPQPKRPPPPPSNEPLPRSPA